MLHSNTSCVVVKLVKCDMSHMFDTWSWRQDVTTGSGDVSFTSCDKNECLVIAEMSALWHWFDNMVLVI